MSQLAGIDGRYHVVRRLPSTTGDTRLLVRDAQLGGRPLVLHLVPTAQASADVLGQLTALTVLRHRNVCRVFGTHRNAQGLWVSYDYVDGPPLEQWRHQAPDAATYAALLEIYHTLTYLREQECVPRRLRASMIIMTTSGRPRLDPVALTLDTTAVPEHTDGDPAKADAVRVFARLAKGVLSASGHAHDETTTMEVIGRLIDECLSTGSRPKATELVENLFQAAAGAQTASKEPTGLSLAPLPPIRSQELQGVVARLDDAVAHGAPAAQALVGQRGSGKTTLLDQIAYRALRRGFSCVRCRSTSELFDELLTLVPNRQRLDQALPRPLQFWNPAVDPGGSESWASRVSDHGNHPLSTTTDKKVASRTSHGRPPSAATKEYSWYFENLQQRPGRFRVGRVPTSLRGAALSRALCALTKCVAHATPLAILFDDVDQLPATDSKAVYDLLRALSHPDPPTEQLPLVVVVAGQSLDVDGVDTTKLQPLKRKQVARLLAALAPTEPLSSTTIDDVHKVCSTSPPLAAELVDAVAWLPAPEVERYLAQPTKEWTGQLAQTQLDELDDNQRAVLQLVSLTPSLDAQAAYALAPQHNVDIVSTLVERGYLDERSVSGRGRLSLHRSHLTSALIAQMSDQDQIHHHARIAAALGHVAGRHSEVALHRERSGACLAAADAYLIASQSEIDIMSRFALRAAQLGGTQWKGWPRCKRQAAYGLIAAGFTDLALPHLRQLAAHPAATAADRLLFAELCLKHVGPQEALNVLAGENSAAAKLCQAKALLANGRDEQARSLAKDLLPHPQAYYLIGLSLGAVGDLEAALAALLEADQKLRSLAASDELRAEVAYAIAVALQQKGDSDASRRWMENAVQYASAANDVSMAGQYQQAYLRMCHTQGRFAEAKNLLARALLQARDACDVNQEGQLHAEAVELYIGLAASTIAQRHLGHAARCLGPNSRQLDLLRCTFLLATRKLQDAAQQIALLSAAPTRDTTASLQARAAALLTRLAWLSGDIDKTKQAARQATTLARRLGEDDIVDEARLLQAIAIASQADADLPHAKLLLEQTCQSMRHRGDKRQLWRAYYELAKVEARVGLSLDSDFHLRKAGQHIDALLEQLSAEDRSSLLARSALTEAYAATRAHVAGRPEPPDAAELSKATKVIEQQMREIAAWRERTRELESKYEALCRQLVPDGDGGDPTAAASTGAPDPDDSLATRLTGYERQLLVEALELTRGKAVDAAKRLGLSRAGFYKKLKRHGLRTR